MTEPKHWPLPWYASIHHNDLHIPPVLIKDKSGRMVGKVWSETEADIITQAVNHYRLLVSIAYRVGLTKCSCGTARCIHKEAKAAWKKAEGIDE